MAASARRGLIDFAISMAGVPAATDRLLPSGRVISMLLIGNFQRSTLWDTLQLVQPVGRHADVHRRDAETLRKTKSKSKPEHAEGAEGAEVQGSGMIHPLLPEDDLHVIAVCAIGADG